MYRQRRAGAAVVLALLATVAGFGVATAASAVTSSHPASTGSTAAVAGAPAPTPLAIPAQAHVVRPGDTLWSLVRRAHPRGDIRPIVQRLAHDRGSATLFVGERIVVP